MKIIVLGPENSIHTERWIEYCNELGYELIFIRRDKKANLLGCKSIYLPEPCPLYEEEQLQEESLLIEDLPLSLIKNRRQFLSRLKTYRDIIKDVKPDIVHSHWIYGHGLFGVLAARNIAPIIQSVWGSDVFLLPIAHDDRYAQLHYVLSHADHILGNSRSMIEMAQSFMYPKKKNASVFVWAIEKYFDLTAYNKSMIRREYGFSDNDVIMLSSRELRPNYNITCILEAYKKAKSKYANLKLILLGKGAGLPEYETRLDLEKDIYCWKKVQHKEVARIMAMADIAISVPFSDSLANTVVESLAMNLYFIGSDLISYRELIQHEINGLLINPVSVEDMFNAIALYFDDPVLRKNINEKNKNFSRNKYEHHVVINGLSNIYKHVLKEGIMQGEELCRR